MAPTKSTLFALLTVLSLSGCASSMNPNTATLGQRIVVNEHRAQVSKVWDGLQLPAG